MTAQTPVSLVAYLNILLLQVKLLWMEADLLYAYIEHAECLCHRQCMSDDDRMDGVEE